MQISGKLYQWRYHELTDVSLFMMSLTLTYGSYSRIVKGCDHNFQVIYFKFKKLLQMKHLPCIKQYVLG